MGIDWSNYGFPIIATVAMASFLVMLLKYAARILLDDEKGLVTRAFNKHLESVDRTLETQAAMLDTMETQTGLLDDLKQQHEDPTAPFATRRLEKAFLHHAEAILKIAEHLGGEVANKVRPLVENMQKELRNGK